MSELDLIWTDLVNSYYLCKQLANARRLIENERKWLNVQNGKSCNQKSALWWTRKCCKNEISTSHCRVIDCKQGQKSDDSDYSVICFKPKTAMMKSGDGKSATSFFPQFWWLEILVTNQSSRLSTDISDITVTKCSISICCGAFGSRKHSHIKACWMELNLCQEFEFYGLPGNPQSELFARTSLWLRVTVLEDTLEEILAE